MTSPSETDLRAQRDAARAFCRANLAECCAEMLEWHNTSLLRDGKMRELAKMCAFASDHALQVAEGMVKNEAMSHAVASLAQANAPEALPRSDSKAEDAAVPGLQDDERAAFMACDKDLFGHADFFYTLDLDGNTFLQHQIQERWLTWQGSAARFERKPTKSPKPA